MFKTLFLLLFSMMIFPVHAAEIVSAQLAQPTEKYQHCVLGDCIEYEAIEAILDDGTKLSFELPNDSVFEDLTPRLIPLGLNGRNAILVVRSFLDKGAALTLLENRSGQLRITAQSEPIGTANRWQNPIGAADFDHDGIVEIASVITPHIGGTLTLFERRGKKLVVDKTAYPFSNHQIGYEEIDLHEIMDWNDDGTPDIVLPNISRHTLQVVTFKGGKIQILAEKELELLISGPMIATETGVEYGLSDGNTETWDRK